MAKKAKTPPVGRPARHEDERLSKNRTFRVRGSLDANLTKAAGAAGRSVSEEIEFRLERSFEDERLLLDALELKFGRELAGLLLTMGDAMHDAGRSAGFNATGTLEGSQQWWNHSIAYREAKAAAVRILDALAPASEAAPSVLPIEEDEGASFANGYLDQIANSGIAGHPTDERMLRLRKRLGLLADRAKNWRNVQ